MPEHQIRSSGPDGTIYLGVVGHRLDKLTETDLAHLLMPVSTVLDKLQQLRSDGRTLHLVTSLAEGADRLVMQLAVERGVPVTVVLPSSAERFEHDFPTERSVGEFRELVSKASTVIEPGSDKPLTTDGYHWASEKIVETSDLLLAVWNGQPGNGPGGTARTIDSALVRDIPVIWLLSGPPYSLDVVEPDSGLRDIPLHRVLHTFQTDSPGPENGAAGRLNRGQLQLS